MQPQQPWHLQHDLRSPTATATAVAQVEGGHRLTHPQNPPDLRPAPVFGPAAGIQFLPSKRSGCYDGIGSLSLDG